MASEEEEEEALPPSMAGYTDFVDIHALRELLTSGDLVLVKASYLMELAATSTRFPRRQDLPDRGVCDLQMIERSLKEIEELMSGRMKWHALAEAHFPAIVIVSYAWGSQDHPDPRCQLLREVLAPALEWYLSERAAYLQRGGFDGQGRIRGEGRNFVFKGWSNGRSLENLDSIDFCVFLDYPSMYQKPRDAQQDAAFKRALNRMELLYGHQYTVKLRATRHLSSMEGLPYNERGWPFFEASVSALISGTWHVFDLGQVDWTQPVKVPELFVDQPTGKCRKIKFDGTAKPAKKLAKQASYHYRNQTTGVAGLLNKGRPVALLPEGFAKGIQSRTFTNQADHVSVIEMHEKLCGRVLASVTDLNFTKLGWSTEEEAADVAQVCLACPKLERLNLLYNRLGPKGVAALADGFAKGVHNTLSTLILDVTDCGDEGTVAICNLICDGKLPQLRLLMVETCGVGDAGFAALKDMVGRHPDVRVVPWDNPGLARALDLDCTPQPACERAPSVVLVRPGGGDGDALVLEHAAALARGERAPLTLASHPGLAIVPVWKRPQIHGNEWSFIPLGVGPAKKAIVAELRGEFLARPSDGRVACAAHERCEAGSVLLLLRHTLFHPERTCIRDGSEPGGRSFGINADGHIVVLKEPGLVWGVKGPAPARASLLGRLLCCGGAAGAYAEG